MTPDNDPVEVSEADRVHLTRLIRASATCSDAKASSYERDFKGGDWFQRPAPPREERRMSQEHEWIQTFTGRRFFPLNPRLEDIDIEDIAHALSHLCRFAGHTRVFYSVAEHAVRVSRLCQQMCPTTTYEACWGLHHDDSEAYLVDLPRPIKRSGIGIGYREAEQRLMNVICRRFNLRPEEPPEIKRADTILLLTERRDLLGISPAAWQEDLSSLTQPLPEQIVPWTSGQARVAFLTQFFLVRQLSPKEMLS